MFSPMSMASDINIKPTPVLMLICGQKGISKVCVTKWATHQNFKQLLDLLLQLMTRQSELLAGLKLQ